MQSAAIDAAPTSSVTVAAAADAHSGHAASSDRRSGSRDSDPALRSAVNFLVDPRVRRTSQERKIAFLRSKGLTAEQICSAFAHVGETITPERVAATTTTAATASSAAPATDATSADASSSSPSHASMYTPRSAFAATRSHTLYPAALLSPPAPLAAAAASPRRTLDWRDVVIAAGAACLAGVAAVHAFMRYSPYEVRRKDTTATRMRVPQRPGLSRRHMSGGGGGRRYSGSDTDVSARERVAGAAAAFVPPATVPALPTTPPSANNNNNSGGATATTADGDEVARLRSELAELKETLTNERKRNAELALSAAKARSDQQKVSHVNAKLTHEVDELKAKVTQLEEAAAAAAAAKSATSATSDAAHDEKSAAANTSRDAAMPDEIKALLPQPATDATTTTTVTTPEATSTTTTTATTTTPEATSTTAAADNAALPDVVPTTAATLTTTTTATAEHTVATATPHTTTAAATTGEENCVVQDADE